MDSSIRSHRERQKKNASSLPLTFNRTRVHTLALLLILLIGALLRFHDLGNKGLLGDEFHTVHASVYGRGILPAYTPTFATVGLIRWLDGQPWMRQWLASLDAPPPAEGDVTAYGTSVGAVGNDALLRLPFALAGILSIYLIFLLGRAVFGPMEGLIAALMLALSPFHIFWSQKARYYSFVVLFTVTSAFFLYRALQTRRTKYWLAFVLASIANVWNLTAGAFPVTSHLAFAGIVVALNGVAAWRQGQARQSDSSQRPAAARPELNRLYKIVRPQALPLLASAFVIALICYPVFRGAAGSIVVPTGDNLPIVESRTTFADTLSSQRIRSLLWVFGGQDGWPLYYGSTALFVFGLATTVWRREWNPFLFVSLHIFLPFLLLFTVLAFVRSHLFYSRHLIFLLPAYLLVVARGLTGCAELASHMAHRLSTRRIPGHRFALLGLAVIGLLSLRSVWQAHLNAPLGGVTGRYPQMIHFYGTEAAHYLERNVEPGDVVVFLFDYRHDGYRPINYYSPPSLQSRTPLLWIRPPLTPAAVEQWLAQYERVWLVGEYEPGSGPELHGLEQRVEKQTEIRRVPIYLLAGDPVFLKKVELRQDVTASDPIRFPHYFGSGPYLLEVAATSPGGCAKQLEVAVAGSPQGVLDAGGAVLPLDPPDSGVHMVELALPATGSFSDCTTSVSEALFHNASAVGPDERLRIEAETLAPPSGAGVEANGSRSFMTREPRGPITEAILWFPETGTYELTLASQSDPSRTISFQILLDDQVMGEIQYLPADAPRWEEEASPLAVDSPGFHRLVITLQQDRLQDQEQPARVDWFEIVRETDD